MIVDVAPYHGAFFAGFAGGRDKGYGEFAAPHEKEKDYFQDILADDVIARQVDFNLPDQAFQVEQKLLFVGLVMDDGVADAAVVPGQGFQAVYAHDNIFQRVFFRTDLCVLNVGIYSNYVPGIDRVGVVHQFQVSPAPCDKKYFSARMRVENGTPFVAVAGHAHIEQFGDGAIHRIYGQRIQDITICTHSWQNSLKTINIAVNK